MRIALIHDWLTGFRGGERVLLSLCRLYPDAVLHTLVHRPGSQPAEIEGMEMRRSFIQHLPLGVRCYRQYLPLLPTAIEQFDLRGFDLVVSSSHCVAKGVEVPDGTPHVCYCHTPMRYVWDMYLDYFGPGRGSPLARLAMPAVSRYLRAWDRATSGGVSRFVANSAYVAERIHRHYGRGAEVVHPPIDIDTFSPGPAGDGDGDYYLLVSALSPYKRVDLVIEAFNRCGTELRIVGFGPEEARLRRMAGPAVSFLGTLPLDELVAQYRGCRAFVYAAVEDFGMALVEAQACGRPVVALGVGGATESVLDGVTGVLYGEQTPEALISAVDRLEGLQLNTREIRENALRFSHRSFERRMAGIVMDCLAGRRRKPRS